jgi:hypothetical protein
VLPLSMSPHPPPPQVLRLGLYSAVSGTTNPWGLLPLELLQVREPEGGSQVAKC